MSKLPIVDIGWVDPWEGHDQMIPISGAMILLDCDRPTLDRLILTHRIFRDKDWVDMKQVEELVKLRRLR